MKILKNNYCSEEKLQRIPEQVKPYPRELTCEECGSELEYEKSDLRIGALGCVYLDCPCCGRDNLIDSHEDAFTLTVDNVEFPVHFFHTSEETGAAACCNNETIKSYIRSAINSFRQDKERFVYHMQTGDLLLVVFRYKGDEDYEVIVSNNYYDTYIPCEAEDY